jgi:hypothetical protein
MLNELYKGNIALLRSQINIEHMLPDSENLSGFDITLGIDISKLPKT